MSNGLLEAHQGVKKDSNPSDTYGSSPSQEEIELCKQIDRMFEKYARHRRKYDKDWIDNYKMYRGQQWLKKRPSYKHKEVINLIYQTIQSQTATMMDIRPTVGFLPQEPADLDLAEILNQVFEADWEKHNWMEELAAIIYDSHIYSVGFGEVCYDPELNHTGGIDFKCRDPLDLYPDPSATDVNRRSVGFIDAEPLDIDVVKRRYAGHRFVDQIKPDMENLSYDKRKVETLHTKKNTDLDLDPERTAYGTQLDYDKDKVMVVTAYLLPSDTEQIEKDDLNSDGEKLYITKKKYPRGRKVVKINKFIFEDGPLKYDDLKFPFCRLLNSTLPREFYGISEVDQLKGPQLTFNKLVNFALDVLTLMGNPIWLVPVGANVNTRKLINQPGLIVEHADEKAPQREEGVGLQPFVFDLIDRMEKWFNDTAGTQDVTRGINPTGVTANAAIENLLEQAQKRIKQKMRHLDSFMKDFGRMWLSRCFQYYTVPQIFRLTNKNGLDTYFKFHIEDREVESEPGDLASAISGAPKKKKVAIVREYVTNDMGQMVPAEKANEYEARGEFDVRVNTISGLPFSKAQNEQQVLNLFDRQIIDGEEVMKRLEYPNYELVMQRVKQAQQEAAANAASAPQQKQGA